MGGSDAPKTAQKEVLLLRAYQEDKEHSTFIVSSRSVRCDSRPLESEHSGVELLPSGYIIEASLAGDKGIASEITFLGQFDHELFNLVLPHVRRSVHEFREIVEREAFNTA